jgi:hypothetical protein
MKISSELDAEDAGHAEVAGTTDGAVIPAQPEVSGVAHHSLLGV